MLSKRLDCIHSLIIPCELLADIGSDHGYLALHALKSNKAKRVIASDFRQKPLDQAKKTFAQANVFDNINYVLSDGLKNYEIIPDCVVIAGMGGDLIIKIIEQDFDRFKMVGQIITQANTKSNVLRSKMALMGFSMIHEKITYDGFFYCVQSYFYTGLCVDIEETQAYFGLLLDLKDTVFVDYLKNQQYLLEHILVQNPNSKKHLHLLKLVRDLLDKRVD
ncbi:MAG: hypothetical protein FD133_1401 [Erysipelotrichaceae bacterium]|nr:MAG: hypothetical protein FD179_684 [Erysipelotrichaceae bacterium]TXT17343.1 MAG: hypothetical protein FD133_1401 [Erysipelotrichaceae bacterium]